MKPLGIIFVFLVIFLYLPLAVVVIFAFNDGSGLSWPLQGLSLRWFALIFADESFSLALLNSIKSALIVSVLSVLIALAAAMLFARHRNLATRTLSGLALLPAMMPPILIAIALFTAMAYFRVAPGFGMIVLGQLVVTLPFVLTVVGAQLERFDLDLEAASRDLGAHQVQTLRRITFPIILPTLVGSALLAFAFAFDELLITNFTSGTTPTLPLYVFSKLRRGIDPSVNAVATLLIAAPWLAVLLAMPFIMARRTTDKNRRVWSQ